jgi:hypothetical protein
MKAIVKFGGGTSNVGFVGVGEVGVGSVGVVVIVGFDVGVGLVVGVGVLGGVILGETEIMLVGVDVTDLVQAVRDSNKKKIAVCIIFMVF